MTQLISTIGKLILLFPALCLLSCSAAALSPTDTAEVLAEYELAPQLSETSGLFCNQNGQFTINDSGNEPVIYQLDQQGGVTRQHELSVLNRDWEAITGDQDYLYIGDFGNNRGKRKWLQIYKVAYDKWSETAKLVFGYSDNVVAENIMYEHDFDAEAMVAREDKLVLFSKSWQTQVLKVYHIDKNEKKQLLSQPASEVGGLPGVITGADWDSANRQYVLVGYGTGLFGITHPFIATLSETYELQRVVKLVGYGQVEGICAMPDNELWLTQEGSSLAAARLIKLKLLNSDSAGNKTSANH
ncbi:hypothetical protein [Alteromonas gilva]|uniref:Uncharacterized protein n=1 Tax=Alteromonas gilva TaxID=2987522 RepID=A0ABT5L5C5_9ALTE|nr:hypothetical protein [Alteromonas gilva]MDC8832078.1 hypothetical protein [Alteromonas gilva]